MLCKDKVANLDFKSKKNIAKHKKSFWFEKNFMTKTKSTHYA